MKTIACHRSFCSFAGSAGLFTAVTAILLLLPVPVAAAGVPVRDSSTNVRSPDSVFYFYQPLTFGSQGKYSPGDFFFNGGYGVWQFASQRKIFEFPYAASWRNTWKNIRHPFMAIEEFGVKEWLTSEIVPASLDLKHGQYFPNYFLHLLGAGMQSRKMEEWYRYHHVPCPRLWSIVTMTAEHIFEEMIEDGGVNGLSKDPVSDLYIFNPAGILLFSSDAVCRFFSDRFSLNEWSLQPGINVRNGQLENMGQFYVVKFPVTRDGRWNLFGYFGMQELLGVTWNFSGSKNLTVSGGLIVNSLGAADISESQKAYTANLRWSAGVFYDDENSLMASLVATGAEHNRFRLNVYPGVFKIGPVSPGIFIDNTGYWAAGFSVRYCPLGISVGSSAH